MKSHTTFRRVAPIPAGFLTVVVITTLTDVILHAIGVFPPWGEPMADGLFVLPLGYRILYAVIGGYVAARLATQKPVTHAVALGAIGLVLSLIGIAATAGKGDAYGPVWYSLLVAATAVPGSWAGGKLFTVRA